MLQYNIAGFVIYLLHAHENCLDIGRRNLVKCFCLQKHRHPVVAAGPFAFALQFGDLVGAGLIPCQHYIEQITIDGEVLNTIARACCYTTWENSGDGIARGVGAADDNILDLAVGNQFQGTGHDVHGTFFRVAFLEQHLLRRQLTDLYLPRKGSQIIPLQSIQWGKGPEQFYIQLLIRHFSSC